MYWEQPATINALIADANKVCANSDAGFSYEARDFVIKKWHPSDSFGYMLLPRARTALVALLSGLDCDVRGFSLMPDFRTAMAAGHDG